jgi:hypothetical protein
METIYKAVEQAVFLCGAESWVMGSNTVVTKTLEAFHHIFAHDNTGQHIQENPAGTWMYPPSTQVLEMAGLFSIQKYLSYTSYL